MLKSYFFQVEKDEDRRLEFVEEVSHNLEEILDFIIRYEENTLNNREYFPWLKAFLSNVSEIDKMSDSFRYPFRIIKGDWFNTYKIKYVFPERKDICLIKLVHKFEIAFDLIEAEYLLSTNPLGDLEIINGWKDYSPIFLEEGGDYKAKSVIGYKFNRSEINIYIKAYSDVAVYLYEEAIHGQPEAAGMYYSPICYLLRNSMELALKQICLIFKNNDSLRAIKKKT